MNNSQLEILVDLLSTIGDKLQMISKEYDDYTIHNMVDWLKNPEIEESVIVKHRYKDYGEGYIREIRIDSMYPVDVHFSFYPEYVSCSFDELEVIK
ncbi:hypothetical protein [Cytobacillus praedii]|uniref:Uncharacterized protein n=1 Tax=Cytobacillus praedii TaxID=1742358 RepID=A0A4R1AQK1_9BACI|nr:hypothetical protein [Cytobacillus praedii]TCI99989.1 hypothetical protein E0Y62_27065 [Cytobacillus praedii]